MGAVDDVLRTVGELVTIERSTGNVSTYFYLSPKDVRWPFETNAMMPTDSGVTGGDIIKHRSDYYIVVGVFEDRRVNEFFYYKVKLYKCNAVVAVKKYNDATKVFSDSATGVRCLIVDSSAFMSSDRSVVVPSYSGRDDIYYLYAQKSVGIDKKTILVDADANHFRVASNINFFFAAGVVEATVKIEVK